MKLRESVPKKSGPGVHREVSAAETLDRVTPYLRTIGVTRVADITWLDRLGIPVYNAIMPRSPDVISVYNGKGATPVDAKVSAVMEAFERFSAWQPRAAELIATYTDLAASGATALDPLTHNLEIDRRYHHDLPISWTYGYDLLNDEQVLIPLCLAGYHRRFHEVQCYRITTSNGIASGNSLEEALCHALCEVIERDSWTMADLVSNRLKHVVRDKLGKAAPPGAVEWLEELHPSLDLATLPQAAQRYVALFEKAGVRLVLRDITSDLGVPSVAAMAVEDVAETFSGTHGGYGAHPDAEVAVLRALTEAAQSRAVDIQGMREDLSMHDDHVESWDLHAQRGPANERPLWPYRESDVPAPFQDLPSRPSGDIMADLRFMLDRLRARGLPRALAVDLSVPGIPVTVVKVVVPGLESWGLDRSRLGPRSGAHWDGTLKTLISQRDGG